MHISCETLPRVSMPYLQREDVSFGALTARSLPRFGGQIARAGRNFAWADADTVLVDGHPTPEHGEVEWVIGRQSAQKHEANCEEDGDGSESCEEMRCCQNVESGEANHDQASNCNRFTSEQEARCGEGLVDTDHTHETVLLASVDGGQCAAFQLIRQVSIPVKGSFA